MRVLVGLLAIASTALAGGCRQSDEAVTAELRNQMMQRCTTDIAPQAASVPGFDSAEFCACVTDKGIGGRSVAELKKMFEDKAATAEQGRQAGAECLNQQTPSATADAAGASNAAQQAAAPPAAREATPAEDEVETNEAGEDEAVEDSQ